MKSLFYNNQTLGASNPYDILSYNEFPQKCVYAVYSNLIALVSEYAESDGFSKAPDNENSLLYYRSRVDKIESMIHQIYKNERLTSAMLSVTAVIKRMTCTCEFPGVPDKWYAINPNLRFYSAAFEVAIDAPEVYEQIKYGFSSMSLEFYPDKSDIRQYFEYFTKLRKLNKDNNYFYDMNYFFQMEIIKTVKIIFENL